MPYDFMQATFSNLQSSNYNMPTVHLVIKGKVQGVFYRASAKKAAVQLTITGWIRNKENGDVEALATGNTIQLNEFIGWCRLGPEGAKVTAVVETWQDETVFDSFIVMH